MKQKTEGEKQSQIRQAAHKNHYLLLQSYTHTFEKKKKKDLIRLDSVLRRISPAEKGSMRFARKPVVRGRRHALFTKSICRKFDGPVPKVTQISRQLFG